MVTELPTSESSDADLVYLCINVNNIWGVELRCLKEI
jgi:hypothetical protein